VKIISIDKVRLLSEDIRELQSMSEVILYSDSPKDINEVQERIRDADILIVNTYPLSPKELRFASHLKLVCVFGTGYDFIDTEYLKQNNILVCNAPRYSTESTAEHAVGLILHASRLVSKAERDLRNGVWSPHAYKGCEIKGRKIGIIGYGNIGKRISEIVKQGFGMDVEYVNSSSVRSELEHLLKTCDVISLNVSLNSKTKNLISDAEFDLMKDGVVIVNTSRGAVIDQERYLLQVSMC
jgi:lactate dehydrogenase-like 2-hydroxyacid dehydrogenase